jgi:hypothetical protein
MNLDIFLWTHEQSARFTPNDPNPEDTQAVVLKCIGHYFAVAGRSRQLTCGYLKLSICDLIQPFWVNQALRQLHRDKKIRLSSVTCDSDDTIRPLQSRGSNMGNSSHHDCYQPGCLNQVAWSTNSCFCIEHRAQEDKTAWDGRDVTQDNKSMPAPTTREDLLKLLDEQCRDYVDLDRQRAVVADESQRVQERLYGVIDRLSRNEIDRSRTMDRLIRVTMGQPDPGPFVHPNSVKGK